MFIVFPGVMAVTVCVIDSFSSHSFGSCRLNKRCWQAANSSAISAAPLAVNILQKVATGVSQIAEYIPSADSDNL